MLLKSTQSLHLDPTILTYCLLGSVAAVTIFTAATIISKFWETGSPVSDSIATVVPLPAQLLVEEKATETTKLDLVDQSTATDGCPPPATLEALSLSQLQNQYIGTFKSYINFVSETIERRVFSLWELEIRQDVPGRAWLAEMREQNPAIMNNLRKIVSDFTYKVICEGENAPMLTNYPSLDIFINLALDYVYYDTLKNVSPELFTTEMADKMSVFLNMYLISSGV